MLVAYHVTGDPLSDVANNVLTKCASNSVDDAVQPLLKMNM